MLKRILKKLLLKWLMSESKEKCKCGWRGYSAECKQEDYCWDGGPLAYAAGMHYLCPKCLTKIKEGNCVRS